MLEIIKIPIDKINPATYNPRIDLRPGDLEYEKLKKSIQEFGYVEPLVWNQSTGNLVGGHQRYKILLEQGYKEVDVSVVDLDDAKEKALNLALNKISGQWDDEKLAFLLQELSEQGLDIAITGFDETEMSELIEQFTFKSDEETEFTNKEIDLDEYSEDKFDCQCPRCGFVFNPKEKIVLEDEQNE